MITITTIKEMQAFVLEKKEQQVSVGFVPTMGYLHEGHRSLMKKARQENDLLVLSIFVNPLQFGPNEDLESYPRDFDRDAEIAKAEGVDVIFFPSAEEMYGRYSSVQVNVKERTDVLCGKSRPGHFDGVATVLTKLFNIVLPNRAYFGLKDAQQVAVVHGLVSDFHFPIEIVPVETVREEDGLAKSSRNVYLSDKERKEAPILYKSLLMAKEKVQSGLTDEIKIISEMKEMIEGRSSGKVDYIEIYSYPELKKVEPLEGKIIIALAVKFNKARLIDNIIFSVNE
ncbi:pantoate--beta-alanine ligase [Bacillus sp. 31A1R]|uniref:Pantothenate synthetase n=1 Tax=Robertmurraya mangrovi TaxID=3098077 RepID=A0ABU5J1J7_9BACI|nr:pantoate--beta-alanine ligase [Bacillus sp. 31A1R]MDZ5473231.1 pantoate--beta-alanine ligase [Bacillus sp. 31A1R]